jgi:hypothetical protein
MIARLQNPLFAALAGIALSIGVGVYFSSRALAPLLTQTVVVPKKELPPGFVERGWDFWTVEIDNLSNELRDERARLRKQVEQLDARATRVAAEEKELAKLRTDLERLRKEISDKVAEVGADEAKNIRTLAQTYSTLTPRAAVAILREIDDTTAVKILAMMKAETVGPIFEEMAKSTGPEGPLAKRAAALSERLRLVRLRQAPGAS